MRQFATSGGVWNYEDVAVGFIGSYVKQFSRGFIFEDRTALSSRKGESHAQITRATYTVCARAPPSWKRRKGLRLQHAWLVRCAHTRCRRGSAADTQSACDRPRLHTTGTRPARDRRAANLRPTFGHRGDHADAGELVVDRPVVRTMTFAAQPRSGRVEPARWRAHELAGSMGWITGSRPSVVVLRRA